MEPPGLSACVLVMLGTAGGPMGSPARAAEMKERPVVGAIRWDAWHGEASSVGLAVEKSLGPKRWHYRLPFFAKEIADTRVEARGDTQEIVDKEIAYASAAGLDYWAFVTYAPDSAMSRGLSLYLSSPRKADIRFCLLLQGGHIGAGGPAGWPTQVARYVGYFKEPTYQKVAGGRPLVYLFAPEHMLGSEKFPAWAEARAAFDALRKAAVAEGLPTPYLVIQHWSVKDANDQMEKLGFDAVSAYASNGGGKQAQYTQLARHTEQWWEQFRATGAKVVPLVSAGWDRRPRVENPVPWEGPGGDIQQCYQAPTPQELADHLKAALDWTVRHPDAAEARAVLIYAWNEFDEGGWLCPTLAEGAARLEAIRGVLERKRP